MDLTFADLSEYELRFDAGAYRKAGHLLVMLKATEGQTWVDPSYAEKVLHARQWGLEVWHYHFAHPDTNPDERGEAAHFWRTVQPHYRPGDRLVLDVELHHPDGAAGLVRYTATLDQRLHSISGQLAILYTYLALIRETGPKWQVQSRQWHVADYSSLVRSIGAGRQVIAQQTSDHVYFAGIGYSDGNVLFDAGLLARRRARKLVRRTVRQRQPAC